MPRRPSVERDPAQFTRWTRLIDLSRPGTDEDEEEYREILFVSRLEKREEEQLPVPKTVQAVSDCEILNMVKTLKVGDSLRLPGYRPNPEGI